MVATVLADMFHMHGIDTILSYQLIRPASFPKIKHTFNPSSIRPAVKAIPLDPVRQHNTLHLYQQTLFNTFPKATFSSSSTVKL
jgi:hypothetical protein